jgi:hypothetical protein
VRPPLAAVADSAQRPLALADCLLRTAGELEQVGLRDTEQDQPGAVAQRGQQAFRLGTRGRRFLVPAAERQAACRYRWPRASSSSAPSFLAIRIPSRASSAASAASPAKAPR